MEKAKSLYRIIAQTDTITITAKTGKDVSEAEAQEAAKEVLVQDMNVYHHFVALPLCTEEQWKGGNVNFCPRCGERLSEPDEDSVDSEYYGMCFNCEAGLGINITICDDNAVEDEVE